MANATIVLSGINKVKGGAADKPAIYIPQDNTLTIRGSGSLEADGTGCGAGIGSGSDSGTTCGDITISGGTVTARKSSAPCSIGKGYGASCGTVTIGGVVYSGGITISPYTYPPN